MPSDPSETKVSIIQRDPFSRTSLVRRQIATSKKCEWCGFRPGIYNYGTQYDDRPERIDWYPKNFCCVKDMRSYYS